MRYWISTFGYRREVPIRVTPPGLAIPQNPNGGASLSSANDLLMRMRSAVHNGFGRDGGVVARRTKHDKRTYLPQMLAR